MPLATGSKLGPYEILAVIGAGGMGEVYRAKDTRLDRTVAIKVLPQHLSSNQNLRERFEREARAVSALNHASICTLHDIGHQDGIDFLVMEYIEGETLASRLDKGALPLESALKYGVQIADALDKAHRLRIVHRDLKPGNIMITKSGVKLLDFGLAKLQKIESDETQSNVSTLATEMRQDLTAEGTIVGTLQYMSPEQLEGKDTDARTDIFAFGSILYEMVTGKKAFSGKSQASLIAAILKETPERVSKVQPLAPLSLDHLINTCLAKDPEDRWQAASDIKHGLQSISDSNLQMTALSERLPSRSSREKLAWALAVIATIASLFLAMRSWKPRIVEQPTAVTYLTIPAKVATYDYHDPPSITVSPDGNTVAFSQNDKAEISGIFLKRMESFECKVMPETENASGTFFSPDGKWLAFASAGKLKKVSIEGGPAILICDSSNDEAGTWGKDGTIVFSPFYGSGLWKVSSEGGKIEALTQLNERAGERAHRWPLFLPDGKNLLYSIHSGPSFEIKRVAVYSFQTGQSKIILDRANRVFYVRPGFLIFDREGTLHAIRFDLEKLSVIGSPIVVIQDVSSHLWTGLSQFFVSESGTIAYFPGYAIARESSSLVWVDRNGVETPVTERRRPYYLPRLSPDGKHLAVTEFEEGRFIISILDLERGTFSRLPTEGSSAFAIWSPDGKEVTYSSNAKGSNDIYVQRADGSGSPKLILSTGKTLLPHNWSRDGLQLILTEVNQKTSGDILIYTSGKGKTAHPFLANVTDEYAAVLSPDGKWIAYNSNKSGAYEIYLQSNSGLGQRWQVSGGSGGSYEPVFSKDQQELYYRHLNQIMVVSLGNAPTPNPTKPRVLLDGPGFGDLDGIPGYDTAPDGRLILIRSSESPKEAQEIRVIVNWISELQRKLPESSR